MSAVVLQVNSLTKSVGDRLLFGDLTFGIEEGEKIGLIAKNGTGKTSLLRILSGADAPDSGDVVFRNGLRVGFLEQESDLDPEMSVIEAAFARKAPETEAIIEYENALADGDPVRITAASERMESARAWDYEDRMKQMLTQLKLTDMTQRVATLSGGQSKRLRIARLLLDSPDLLILDEPTNHLDIETVEWLENYLGRARIALLMVTHDRYFLDRVCNRIFEIDRTELFSYDGNYDYYLRKRQERIDALGAELAKVKNKLRKEQEWMNRQPQARAGKARYRIESFYDLKERSGINLQEKNVSLDVRSSYIGNKIFEAENVSKRFGDRVILDGFTYTFSRYEKVGIIGANGVGKSTFIKMLMGLVPQDSGSWNVGETVRFGYYSQDGISFNPEKKVIDVVTEIAEDIVYNEGEHIAPMQFLQRFLFSPADQQKYISTLSGGEKARLHLASVLMRNPNFLILDEPTNDLDIITLGILEEYLADFKGCVMVVSHDRFFLDSIVDHLFVFKGNGVVKDFPGGYTDYREYVRMNEKPQPDPGSRETPAKGQGRIRADRPQRMSFRERKEFESLAAEIETLTAERQDIERRFSDGTGDMASLSVRYAEIKDLLDVKEMRWLELSEKE